MKLNEILELTDTEIKIIFEGLEDIFQEIKLIIKDGVKQGVDKISKGLYSLASQHLGKLSQKSKEYIILQKIKSNPSQASAQLLINYIKDNPKLHIDLPDVKDTIPVLKDVIK